MHIIAATFLLPLGVAVYTFVGGIKATFLTDYFHTFIIMIILCYFSVKTFALEEVGSLSNLFELVKAAGDRHPVPGNEQGSYLTMTSKGGIYFGILHLCANFGLVIMDSSFFQKSFSASPSAVVPGYVIGGVAYFAIPWTIGTLASSVVLGLENNPIFPTYPRVSSSHLHVLQVTNHSTAHDFYGSEQRPCSTIFCNDHCWERRSSRNAPHYIHGRYFNLECTDYRRLFDHQF